MYRSGQEEIDAVVRVMQSRQWFRYGEVAQGHRGEAARFERAWAEVMGSPHGCFTSSGTGALVSCYAGLGLGPGDEVIVPAYTWVASAAAPLAVGAVPVIVDVDGSLTIDPAAIEAAITPRTKAICPVHMVGFASDMEAILRLAAKHHIAVVEDACQCGGGRWHDQRLGALGDMGAYSFNHAKIVSCGDGGLFVAKEARHFERAQIFHDCGIAFRQRTEKLTEPIFSGMNLRGNEILAAIMNVQLGRLDGIIHDLHAARARIAERVGAVLTHIPTHGGAMSGTGAHLAYRFGDFKAARAFATAFNADARRNGAIAVLPIESGRHVYKNWEAIMNKRGGPTDATNPYLLAANANAPGYSLDMCTTTLSILKSTVLVPVNPDWTLVEQDAVADAITAAG